ncbi:MAG: cache domain-containing protein, partial [Methylocella sp.]
MRSLKSLLFTSSLGLCMAILSTTAMAEEHATRDEAKAMTVRAAEFLKANGPEKAFAAFNDPHGPFRDRDLYVVVQNREGMIEAHGTTPALVGKNLSDLKDVDGKAFVKEIIAVETAGWVNYKWK